MSSCDGTDRPSRPDSARGAAEELKGGGGGRLCEPPIVVGVVGEYGVDLVIENTSERDGRDCLWEVGSDSLEDLRSPPGEAMRGIECCGGFGCAYDDVNAGL